LENKNKQEIEEKFKIKNSEVDNSGYGVLKEEKRHVKVLSRS
jgi:hypothetical protein